MTAWGDLETLLSGPVPQAAPRLLGAALTANGVTLRVTEVEAYDGANDPGSHAYRGMTPRNEVMFGPPGRVYVYFTYGMHFCANIVCATEGTPSAVLLRAGEVVGGLDIARQRRPGAADRDLARGPARLCRTLDWGRAENGMSLRGPDPRLVLGPPLPEPAIATGPRVGLRHAADRPWRFWIAGERTVSAYRPAAPRRRR